jgi:hypothetical protein
MNKPEPTKLETVSGSLPAGIATNAIAIFGTSVTPLAAFVPYLLQSLATRRHAKRVDQTLKDVNEILESQEEAIKNLSDNQYKLINEVVASIFQTVDEEKMLFLKAVVSNTIALDAIDTKDVDYISRVIRDISIDEIKFILNNFEYKQIFFGDEFEIDNALFIKHGSDEEVIASGLINMGLLYSKVSTWDSVRFEFSPVVMKLLALLKK